MEFQEFGKENSRKITKERRGNLPGILCFEVLKRQFWIMIRKKVRSNDDDR